MTRIDFIGEINPIAVHVSLDELPIGATEKVRTPKGEDEPEVDAKLNDMGGQRIDK